jgi:N-acetylmuramoyl-L-alanine amidase
MSTAYTVKQGDDLFTIAKQFQFNDWRTIYLDAANAGLRELRRDPGLLFPGDVVTIPDKQPRVEEAGTGKRHVYHTHGMTRILRIRLLDVFGKPFANKAYRLELEGKLINNGNTDGDGMLTEDIPMTAHHGKVSLEEVWWDIAVGDLNPVVRTEDDGVSGAQGRLLNLGYRPGPVDGKLGPLTRDALLRFQRDQKLKASGALDDATEARLVAVHGC